VKRFTLVAAVVTLAVPSGALAAGRVIRFNARVLRSDTLGVVLRRADGRTVRFAAAQITGVPSSATVSGDRHDPLAHTAAGPPGAGSPIAGLSPGVLVRVVETLGAGGRPTVRLRLPGGAGARQHAAGEVGAVSAGSFLLDAANGLELRLEGTVAGLRPCATASVVYHQEKLSLVADRVTVTGRSDCAR
jgi:hypothetical protein